MSLSVPLQADGDGLFSLMLAKLLDTQAWLGVNHDLAYPFGSSTYDQPTHYADFTQLLMLKLLTGMTDSPGAVVNVFFLLTFPLVAASAYAVLRALGFARPVVAACAVVYALLPFHFLRGEGHLFLSAYYAAPIGAWLVLGVMGRVPLALRRAGERGVARLADARDADHRGRLRACGIVGRLLRRADRGARAGRRGGAGAGRLAPEGGAPGGDRGGRGARDADRGRGADDRLAHASRRQRDGHAAPAVGVGGLRPEVREPRPAPARPSRAAARRPRGALLRADPASRRGAQPRRSGCCSPSGSASSVARRWRAPPGASRAATAAGFCGTAASPQAQRSRSPPSAAARRCSRISSGRSCAPGAGSRH